MSLIDIPSDVRNLILNYLDPIDFSNTVQSSQLWNKSSTPKQLQEAIIRYQHSAEEAKKKQQLEEVSKISNNIFGNIFKFEGDDAEEKETHAQESLASLISNIMGTVGNIMDQEETPDFNTLMSSVLGAMGPDTMKEISNAVSDAVIIPQDQPLTEVVNNVLKDEDLEMPPNMEGPLTMIGIMNGIGPRLEINESNLKNELVEDSEEPL